MLVVMFLLPSPANHGMNIGPPPHHSYCTRLLRDRTYNQVVMCTNASSEGPWFHHSCTDNKATNSSISSQKWMVAPHKRDFDI